MTIAATLYVAATPLGNLGDVTQRLVACLQDCAVVYAEDTRRSRVLLDHLGVDKPLRSLHEHNEQQRSHEVLSHLAQNQSVVLLTDAGTPAVSDPGCDVVAAALAQGYRVSPIVGPSALAAALSVSGFRCDNVLFLGFIPPKGAERRAILEQITRHTGPVVLFEAPHRIAHTVSDLHADDPQRELCVCREMTKMHEEIKRAPLADLLAWSQGEVLGELTLVLGPKTIQEQTIEEQTILEALKRCLVAELSVRDASTAVAAVYDLPRRDVYRLAITVTKE